MSPLNSSRFFPGLDLGGLSVLSLPGLQGYEEVRQKQFELIEKRARDEIPDTLLFLEHRPVVTRGRGLQRSAADDDSAPRSMPLLAPLPPGVEFCESERGGDLTYHGPGQLVIYPIWKIRDITAFLRGWENLLVSWMRDLGLEAQPVQDATGVWIGATEAQRKKVASIGIAVRRWVTYHGIAINLVNDLEPFSLISPCGFSPEVMTRLKDVLPLQMELHSATETGQWRVWAEREIRDRVKRPQA